jgi:hypothetical protein
MVNILKLWKPDQYSYKERLSFFAWYLYSSRIEGLHPMNCGFWTVRHRKDRRSGLPQEALISFWWNQSKRLTSRVWGIVKLFFQLEEVWLRSRPKSAMEEALHDMIAKTGHGIVDWRDIKVKQLAALYSKLNIEMPEIKVPSIVKLWFRKRNPFAGAFSRTYAQRIWQRWYVHIWNPLKWLEVWLFECVNGFRFLGHLLGEEIKKGPASSCNLTQK